MLSGKTVFLFVLTLFSVFSQKAMKMYYKDDALSKKKGDLFFKYSPYFRQKDLYIALEEKYRGRCATFQEAMKLTIIIGQCFGLNPVIGVTEIDTSKLRFKLSSLRCMYSIISIVGQCFLVGLCFMKIFIDTHSSLSSNQSIIFYVVNCLTSIKFFYMATRWPRVCQFISKTEAADPNMDRGVVRRCNLACTVILSLALVEHLLSDLSIISGAIDCHPTRNIYESFIAASFPWTYTYLPYSHPMGVALQIINIQCTFNWNFSDVFIICISLYLTSRLEQINQRIVVLQGKVMPSTFWRTMREDYSRATFLVKKLDDFIGGITFISFANNLFFICIQLLYTLEDGIKAQPSCRVGLPDERLLQGYEKDVYFIYSIVFLLTRSLAVSLIASRVHTASRAPAASLYEVPSSSFCIEVQRFLDQIHGDTVALSGMQFFNVKRGLVLTIAGTIVTYELVLMQFTGVTPTSGPPLSMFYPPLTNLTAKIKNIT